MDYSTPPSHRSNPFPLTVETVAAESSPSPLQKSKARLTDRLEIVADELPEPAVVRQRRKGRDSSIAVGQLPKKARRARKRSTEVAIREEKDAVLAEEVGKPRKRRNNVRSKKEKVNLVPSVPYSSSSLTEEENGIDLDHVGQILGDLIMWKDSPKSVLWFGLGSLCFLSSYFTKGLNFSIFSAMSQFAIPFLGFSFFSNSILQRNQVEKNCEFKLKESDVLHLAKLILPALNFAISKTRVLFSGEPSMTLKVAPFLLLGAKYGHLITMWRLCAIGFIGSFTVPKLYSSYSAHINQISECMKSWLLDTWCACTHKKKMIAALLMAFWNLSSVKTRIFTAFILLVLFRHVKQHVLLEIADGEAREVEKEQQLAPVVVESVEKETLQASVSAEPEEKERQQALVVWEEQSVPKPAP
ncbi:PREDICTED: reticulon-like protein B17 isoform X2 [Lupinus angustifolius]|uniref:reticulon-like protein B17 isoform X2 n=1 Tax=Lupinus angustifolius TaxID=3871 RepID=UPI00092FB5CB|nr:PREDICTED: reticulon-like protein B17 isoform X2 [Lupinus angustifolius]